MAAPAIKPRFTNVETLQSYVSAKSNSVDKEAAMRTMLASSERFIERYTRQRFVPEPALADPSTGYQRRVVGIASASVPASASGVIELHFDGGATGQLELPLTAAELQPVLEVVMGSGNVQCAGGPLPGYPISVTFAGSLTGVQPELTADSSGLDQGYCYVNDAGFDSLPPVLKRFTSNGETWVRLPSLRVVDPGVDPRMPSVAGITLAGRRLLPNQYTLGYNSYAEGGSDDMGSPDTEPATHIVIGYSYGVSLSPAEQFSFLSPLQYEPNDLQIVGRWGWLTPPEDLVDVVYRCAARGYREREAAYSDQLVVPDGMVYQFFKSLPAFVQAVADSLRVPNFALVG